jgi:pimeloyl-ACP methyl ester carboxylesterase
MFSRSRSTKHHTVQVGSATLAYEVSGDGPPLVFIHGLSGSGGWWSRNTPSFAPYFRVYTIDLIGFGASRRQPFVLDKASALLYEWLRSLTPGPVSLVGHSMGGFIAADLAADHPDAVDRLVLVDPALLLHHGYIQRALGLARAGPRLPLDFWPVLVGDALRAGPLTLAQAIRQLLNPHRAPNLAAIRASTLIVWGQYDTILPAKLARPIQQAIPTAERLEIIAGAGHNPMWDRPAEFNRLVLDFLQSGERSQARAG